MFFYISIQFQGVQHVITDIMQQMYSRVGTPEDTKHLEQDWKERLLEIEERLKAFQKSHIHHPSSPDSQVGQTIHIYIYINICDLIFKNRPFPEK